MALILWYHDIMISTYFDTRQICPNHLQKGRWRSLDSIFSIKIATTEKDKDTELRMPFLVKRSQMIDKIFHVFICLQSGFCAMLSCLVAFQVRRSPAFIVTMITFVRLFSSMQSLVSLEIPSLSGRIVSLIT